MIALEDMYRELRPYAFAIAYRMLGSVNAAEDVVQAAFLRIADRAPNDIESPKAYLATITTRLAIDSLTSARSQREVYVGPWLPEPLVETAPDGAAAAELADSLSMAFLVVLESLTPLERAVFLLHDVFDYGYDEIASIVGKSASNCRQIASRARNRIVEAKPRFTASREQRADLTKQFFAACRDGDMHGLVDLLAGDAAFYGDGGETGAGIIQPIFGSKNVGRFLLGMFRRGNFLGVQMVPIEVNGQPGAKFLDPEGRLINVMSLDISEGVVVAIRSIVNPEKLQHLGPLSPIGRRTS
jgi:RNA polymerase sigma-70 factor (ECF subfamily)